MSKQVPVNSDKNKSSSRNLQHQNVVPVSSLRPVASAGNLPSPKGSSAAGFYHPQVSFDKNLDELCKTSESQARTLSSSLTCQTQTAMDHSEPTVVSVSESKPVSHVPNICTSSSHGLSTISEKNSTETNEALHNQADATSRTSSSCSMPEYLYHKLSHSSKLTAGAASNDVLPNDADKTLLKPPQPPRSTAGSSVAQATVQASSSTSRIVKELCESSASTTTSESYQLSDLPPLPAKLATLSKPSSQALLATALRSRKARHSIDVRALPSYLARKRQSTFGQFLSAFNPTAPDESSSSDDPLFSEPVAPTLSLGERVAWVKSSGPEFGIVKWIGRMPQVTIDWTVGVEFDNAIGNGDGTVEGRRYFVAKENFAKFLPLADLTKVDNYAGRPRSGTMLSRMSVQLKPGQLISIQRSPTANVPHCYLNAPHHVGHDVHSPNNRHCQCNSCNHPCAHICKTRKPKGKKWTDEMAHMCHFSSKPHAHMCCGGEDLPSAAQPIMEPGISWKHSEVISSLRTVPTEPRRKSVANHSREVELKKSPRKRNTSPNYVRENCNSAFLQRSGSDLSISSLPSTSSVAEVYIGRSVLTDESDIDSETERSLESSSKAGNKPGFRSLVACFLANSLRLKKPDKKPKPSRTYGNGNRNKKSSRGDKDRIRSHHLKQNRLGLSSTDGDSYADTPQPLTSLSSDVSRHANEVPISRPSALYSSPKYASCNSKNFKSSKNSPCRINEFIQQHHIDGHISEEATSSSSAARFVSVERSDSNEKRPSTNASSENAASPRRRRNKGPAPKPPVHTTQCSSSPLSTNVSTSCPSSLPQSPSNASTVTTASSSTTSKKQSGATKTSAPLSPHLTRSLSEQKQLNMKNMINAMPSFRSEINLQDINQPNANQTAPDEPAQIKHDENIILVYEESITKQSHKESKQPSVQSKKPEELIYETPMSIKACLEEVPPALPDKTFDPIKMFGCGFNAETKLLEKSNHFDGINSPTMMNRSKSMPFEYICCAYHWKQYLTTIAKTNQIAVCDNLNEMPNKFSAKNSTHTCNRKCCHSMNRTNDDSECDSEDECTISSDLMNALLSPKHSLRYKKSKDNLNKKAQFEQENTIGANLNQLCNTIGNYEFIRAMSDGSLTNTSTTTVVEFINDEDAPDEDKTHNTNPDTINSNDMTGIVYASMIDPTKTNGNANAEQQNRRCLSDVFCQTNFNELPERPTRRYKHYKHSCRCRHLKNSSHDHVHNRHCRSRHNECCPPAQTMPCFAHDIKSSMLTSSPSDHSLSSLSSSTSTLSEASTMRTSSVLSNDASNLKPQSFFPSISPFGDSVTHFSEADINPYKEDPYIELISGRSPISTERLFKSAENNFETLTNESSLNRKSATTFHEKSNNFPLNNTNSSSELNAEMFMNNCLPGKINNGKLPSQGWSEESQIKCLMSELELAISLGNHHRASILAKELAIKRANCSLTGKKSNDAVPSSSPIVAYLYIEDRNAHRGPIPFQVYSTMSVNMLKLKVEKEFGIPSELQKWVLGRTIATNLNASLSTYGITNSGCPIFLYVLPQHLNLIHNKNNTNIQPSNEIPRTNGNLSDDDNIYESLRPMSATSYAEYNNIDQQQQTNANTNTLPRKNVHNLPGDNGCNNTQNALATLNLNSDGTNAIYLTENKYPNSTTLMSMPTASDTIISNNLPKNQNAGLLQNYYYQEGEVPFTDELVFEGLSLVNELLPRVDEENEEELEEEEQLTEKEVNNPTVNNNLDNVEVTQLEGSVSTYQKLIELEETKCVVNNEPFECPICFGQFKSGEGVVLRECLHIFCRDCLNSTIEYNEEVQVKCPFRDNLYSCGCYVQDREIRELATPEIYERYLRKSVAIAEKNLDKSFHCKTVDCPGWCIYDDNVNVFNCPACQHTNCINCQAVHEGVNCRQYQEELEFNAANSEDAKKTKQFLEDMINREEALRCPQCKVIVMKKWGCDWVKCSMCDTEICWITKGFRWGPKGKGDTSGGCRCMINGQRCHPNCKYCH